MSITPDHKRRIRKARRLQYAAAIIGLVGTFGAPFLLFTQWGMDYFPLSIMIPPGIAMLIVVWLVFWARSIYEDVALDAGMDAISLFHRRRP